MAVTNSALKTLTDLGWTCLSCNCPRVKGHDCVNKKYPGVIIEERETWFRIMKRGFPIASDNSYKLNETLKQHGLV